MRIWRSIGLMALALATLTLPAHAQDSTGAEVKPAAAKSSVPERRAWMIGFNYGHGGTRFVGTDEIVIAELRSNTSSEYPLFLLIGTPDWSKTDIESAPTVQFRLGYAINPKWSVGFERSQWAKAFREYKWSFSQSTITATYHPGAGSFFVRGGAGISTLAEKIPLVAPFFIHYQDHGFGLGLAAGYERRLYQRVSIAPEVSIRSMTYAHAIRSQIGSATLGFNWWF